VGRSDYGFSQTGTVSAGPEQVIAWWFHADRRNEFQKRVETVIVADGEVSVTYSISAGVRSRTFQWRDRKGWGHHHYGETRLAADGLPAHDGHRFVAPTSEVITLTSPSGRVGRTVTCSGRTEFNPQSTGHTEISVVHQHVMVGGDWIQRWAHRRSERKNSDQLFRGLITQCQAAVGQSDT